MGKHSEPSKKSVTTLSESQLLSNNVLIIRLVIAVVVLIAALILRDSVILRTVLLVISAAAAGFDIVIGAVNAFEKQDYFAAPVLILFVVLLSFVIGLPFEGALIVILYQVGQFLAKYATEHSVDSALELLQYQSEETREKASAVIESDEAAETELEGEMRFAANSALRYAILFAGLFAVLIPLFTDMTFREAIRRSLAILSVCTPLSVVISFPVVAKIATAYAAQFGTLFNSAAVMEKTATADTAVIDKNGVFTQSSPKLLAIQSDILDKNVFMNFVAHAVYYSEQPFAKAIGDAFEEEYRLDLISDFNDIPGAGCDAKIGGALVTLGTRELFTGRGEAVPYEADSDHPIFYLMVAGKYIGKIELSDDVNQDSESLIEDLKAGSITQCILMTEEGKDESEHLGTALDADAVYAECDTEKKVKVVAKVSAENPKSMFIYANGIEQHSAAAVDIRISNKTKFADALVAPDQVGDLPAAIKACRRMREIMQENGLVAYLVKILMIYLSILGKVSIWFVFFMDIVIGLATILNAIRVTQEPLFDVWKLLRKNQ